MELTTFVFHAVEALQNSHHAQYFSQLLNPDRPPPDSLWWSTGNSFEWYFSGFTGRSYLNADNGQYCAWYVITISFDVVESASIPMATLNQQAELYAFICVWTLAKDKTANINIDSKYAFRVAHDFGTLGKQHHFLISSENNIKSRPYACIQELLDAISTVTA